MVREDRVGKISRASRKRIRCQSTRKLQLPTETGSCQNQLEEATKLIFGTTSSLECPDDVILSGHIFFSVQNLQALVGHLCCRFASLARSALHTSFASHAYAWYLIIDGIRTIPPGIHIFLTCCSSFLAEIVFLQLSLRSLISQRGSAGFFGDPTQISNLDCPCCVTNTAWESVCCSMGN